MPVRNGARYVESACLSILEQRDADFEFLIVDDGSDDETPAILRRLAEADARVRVLRQGGDGLVAALNLGLRESRAPLIARMDADDLALPGRLARQMAVMDAKPGLAALGTGWRAIDADGRETGVVRPPASAAAVRDVLATRNCLAHPSVMIRRELASYRPALTGAEDYDLWLRLSETHDVENLPDPLIALRAHPTQTTRVRQEQRILAEIAANWLHHCRLRGAEPAFDAEGTMDRATLAAIGMPREAISAGVIARAMGASIEARRGGDKATARAAARLVLAEAPPRWRTRLHAWLLLLGVPA
jgi:glycosyltransferase involved in cell wall biosynthesis